MSENTEAAPEVRYPGCEVTLLGTDAHAVAIIMTVARGLTKYLRTTGMDPVEISAIAQEFKDEARSGDYDNVLITCHRWVSVS